MIHRLCTLVEMGELTQHQAACEGLFWYVQALQSCRAQLVEAESMRPRVYCLDAKGIRVCE